MSPPPVVRAERLVKRYGGLHVLDGVSLDAQAGTITAIVGANGAGKTTLFRCLSGSLRPDSGRVLLRGRDVTHLPSDARSRRGLVPTYQLGTTFPTLTVFDNVLVAAENRHRRSVLRTLLGRSSPAMRARAAAVLDRLGLTALADRPAGGLPTGTLRLVELGRALAANPVVLLLDEPVSGLDRSESDAVVRLLRAIAADGVAVLVVEHDRTFVRAVADRVGVLDAGRLTALGPVDELAGQETR